MQPNRRTFLHLDPSKSSRNSLSGSNILSLLLEGLEELSLHPAAATIRAGGEGEVEGINILRHPIKSPNAFIALG